MPDIMTADDQVAPMPMATPLKIMLPHQTGLITSMCARGSHVFLGSDTGCVYEADLTQGSVDVIARVHSVWSLAQRGCLLVFGSLNGDIHILNLEARDKLETIGAHGQGVRCLEFLDDATVVAASKDGLIQSWALQGNLSKPIKRFSGHTKEVRCLSVHGGRIVSGSYDHDARVWDSETAECLHVLRGHTGNIHFIKFNGARAVTSSADGDIRVWDTVTGSCLATILGYGDHGVRIAPLRLIGDTIFAGAPNGSFQSWNLTADPLAPRTLSKVGESSLADLDINGRSIVCGDESGTVTLLDMDSRQIKARWKDHNKPTSIFRVGFAGTTALVVCSQNASTQLVAFN